MPLKALLLIFTFQIKKPLYSKYIKNTIHYRVKQDSKGKKHIQRLLVGIQMIVGAMTSLFGNMPTNYFSYGH